MCKKELKLKISSLQSIAKYAAKSSEKFNLIIILVKAGTMQQYAKNVENMQSILDALQEHNYESSMPAYNGNARAVKMMSITILKSKVLTKFLMKAMKTQRF